MVKIMISQSSDYPFKIIMFETQSRKRFSSGDSNLLPYDNPKIF